MRRIGKNFGEVCERVSGQAEFNAVDLTMRWIGVQPIKQFTLARLLCLTLACTWPGVAGPLFPCVKAVASDHGHFMVVVTDVPVEPKQEIPVKTRRVALQVFPKEDFINDKDRVVAPATYWTDWERWSVVLDSSNMHNQPECPLPLITDDGEFVILLRTGSISAEDSALLTIYRKRDHPGEAVGEGPDHGVFIKDITLRELWPPDRLATIPSVWNDESPEWFVGGTFEFSADYRQLIHKTSWGNTVRINLEDGSVARQ